MSRPGSVLVETERLRLLLPSPDDALRMLAYFSANREHLAPWDPPHPERFGTEEYHRERLEKNLEDFAARRGVRMALVAREQPDGPVLGTCNFSQVVRGAFQACTLGYSLASRFEGQGLMTEALRGAIPFVFETFGVHRIQANHRPENVRSARLLRRLGFSVEGYARDYLFIDGAWRDHVLNAIAHPHPQPPLVE